MPANVPPAVTTEPLVVLVKPVPVNVMTVPTGAPTAIPVGDCEVMAGPATDTAAGNWLLFAAVFNTTTLYGPAVEPVPTADTLNVAAVPALLRVLLRRTFDWETVPVPT
jgi:hypothetical protein